MTGTNATTVINSIISDAPAGVGLYADSTATLSATFNNVYGNTSGAYGGSLSSLTGTLGNIAADPLYVDPSLRDFTLQVLSPSIDAGDPSASYTDADGTPNDQGAFGGPNGDGW
jgi:hypothetical protein